MLSFFKKNKKKHLVISLFYSCAPKITIIWCTVPEIFCHFWSFFALSLPWRPGKSKFWTIEKNTWRYCHFTHVHHKWQSYNVWFMTYGARPTRIFCHFGPFGRFLPFYPPNDPQNQNFIKTKLTPGDIISEMCTKILV